MKGALYKRCGCRDAVTGGRQGRACPLRSRRGHGLALASGADLKAIQDMLGHASIVLTADTCTSVLPEVSRRTVEGIAALIVQAGRIPPGRSLDSPPAHHGPTRTAAMVRTGGKAQVGTGAPPGT